MFNVVCYVFDIVDMYKLLSVKLCVPTELIHVFISSFKTVYA